MNPPRDERRRSGQGERRPNAPASIEGRIPPHDMGAEKAVLSACMLWPEAVPEVAVLLPADRFYSDAHQWIARACYALSTEGKPTDIVAVAAWLREHGRLQQIGGSSYLAEIVDATPAVANVLDHARIVRDTWRLRQLAAKCQYAQAQVYVGVGDVATFLDSVEADIQSVSNDAAEDTEAPTLRIVLAEVFRDLTSESPDTGIQTGLVDLDALIRGIRPGQMAIIAAHSGIGKSAMGMQIVLHAAAHKVMLLNDRDEPTEYQQAALVFSHEMTAHELATRALFSEARIHGSKSSQMSKISREEWAEITATAQRLPIDSVYFDDRPALSPLQIRAKSRRVAAQARKHGQRLRVILVDYIQLMGADDTGQSHERRDQELAAASRGLKGLSKELGVPVIVLAQLNDDAHQKGRLPRKEDLRECKAIVHDADKVILIWNESAFERSHTFREPGAVFDPEAADLLVDKCRGGGECGRVLAWFTPHIVRFDNMSREDRDRIIEERRTAAEERRGKKGTR